MKYLLAAFFACSVSAAFAGCSNFTDGSLSSIEAPLYRVCYDDVCDITQQDYVCSNINSYQAGYAIGWTLDCTITGGEEQCVIAWQGRAIDPAKHDLITITQLPE